jgi:hypothetical protein
MLCSASKTQKTCNMVGNRLYRVRDLSIWRPYRRFSEKIGFKSQPQPYLSPYGQQHVEWQQELQPADT